MEYRIYLTSISDKVYSKGYIVFDAICGGNNVEESQSPVLEIYAITFPGHLAAESMPQILSVAQRQNSIHMLIKPYGRINNMFLEQAGSSIYTYYGGVEINAAAMHFAKYVRAQVELFGKIDLYAISHGSQPAFRFLLKQAGADAINDWNNIIVYNGHGKLPSEMPKLRSGALEGRCAACAEHLIRSGERDKALVIKSKKLNI